MIQYDMIWYDTIWYDMVYGVICYNIIYTSVQFYMLLNGSVDNVVKGSIQILNRIENMPMEYDTNC